MKFLDGVNWVVILGVLVAVETQIGNGSMSLAHMVPDAWIPAVKAWAANLGSLGALIAASGAYGRVPALGVSQGGLGTGIKAGAIVALLFASQAVFVGNARAADVAAPVFPIKAQQAFQPADCTPASCSGWYAGVGLTGNGTNADIIGNGLNQSVFAAGGILDLHGGYQMWNGTYLFAVEAAVGNQFSNGPVNQFGAKTLVGYEIVKFGGALSGLFNQTSPAPGQAPASFSVPAAINQAMISPYFAMGAIQRAGINAWATGAGAEFALAQGWNLDTRYMFAPAQQGLNALNMITIGLNYHFKH